MKDIKELKIKHEIRWREIQTIAKILLVGKYKNHHISIVYLDNFYGNNIDKLKIMEKNKKIVRDFIIKSYEQKYIEFTDKKFEIVDIKFLNKQVSVGDYFININSLGNIIYIKNNRKGSFFS